MRVIALCLLLAGCAAPTTRVVHVTWIKDAGAASSSVRVADNCMIRTGTERVGYVEFGALFRRCLVD